MAYNPAQYEGARRNIEDKWNANASQNAYGRFISQQRGNRGLSDMNRGYSRGMPGLQSSFNRRGLAGGGLSSGVQQGALNRYVGDYQRGFGRAQQDLSQTMQGYDLSDQMNNIWYQGAVGDMELQQQNDIAAAASNIDALRQYLGGL